MSYTAATISSTGATIPTYSDILAYLKEQFQTIYGQSESLTTDSAAYQMISLIALIASDTNQFGQLVYNCRSPLLAIGSSLDPLGEICGGIIRSPGSYSSAAVTLSGTAGTVISSGVLMDTNGNLWNLPSSVTIGNSGTVTVTATANDMGAVSAAAGTITEIYSGSTSGWTSATNAANATVGTNVESDASYRARMIISQAIPGETMYNSTLAALENVSGVTRVNVIENDTGSIDSYGTPAHSITAVVEGGTDTDVAKAIYTYKGIGAYTNGTTSIVVTDSTTAIQTTISFTRPTNTPIYAALAVKSLANYTTATTTAIRAAIVSYLNSLKIGQEVTISALYATALSVLTTLTSPTFSVTSITAGTSSGSQSANDVVLEYYQVSTGTSVNITITVS